MKLSDKKKLSKHIVDNVGSGMNVEQATNAANQWLKRNGFRRVTLSNEDTKKIIDLHRNGGCLG